MPQLSFFISCMLTAATTSAIHFSNAGDEMGLAQTTATTAKSTSVSIRVTQITLSHDEYDTYGSANLYLKCKVGDDKWSKSVTVDKGEDEWTWATGEATFLGLVADPNKVSFACEIYDQDFIKEDELVGTEKWTIENSESKFGFLLEGEGGWEGDWKQ